MNESSKILLYGLLASILLIALCLYTHQNEFTNEVKEVLSEPIEKVEKKIEQKEEVTKAIIETKTNVKHLPVEKEEVVKTTTIETTISEKEKEVILATALNKVESVDKEMDKEESIAEVVATVVERNETSISKIDENTSSVIQKRTDFKNREEVVLTEHNKTEENKEKAEMSDKNLPINDDVPLIDNEKTDKKKETSTKKDDNNLTISTAQEKISLIINRNISFYKNKAKITKKSKRTLNSVIKILKKVPSAKIVVKGYTDASGKESINQWISEARAKSVKKYLGQHGIPLESIEAKGFGESELLYGDKPYSKLNRRVEIEIRRK